MIDAAGGRGQPSHASFERTYAGAKTSSGTTVRPGKTAASNAADPACAPATRHLAACLARQQSVSPVPRDRKSTRLNSSHLVISYAVFCLKKKKKDTTKTQDYSMGTA